MKYIITYLIITTSVIGGKTTTTYERMEDHYINRQNAMWKYKYLIEYEKQADGRRFMLKNDYTIKGVQQLKIDSAK